MSLAALLEWDGGTDTRYELTDGRIVAMVPPIGAHGTVVANLACHVGNRLKPPGRVVVEAGITPPDRADTWCRPIWSSPARLPSAAPVPSPIRA